AITIWQLEEHAEGDRLILIGANPAASATLGFNLEEFVGHSSHELFPEAKPELRALHVQVARTGVAAEGRDVTYGDQRVPLATRYTYTLPLPGRCVAIISEDRSEVAALENETLRLNRFLTAIIDNMPAMVFVKDAQELRFRVFNRAGEQLLGLTREQ